MEWMCAFWAAVMVAVLAYVLIRGWRRQRALDRWNAGLCLKCGYDLRATRVNCPECGVPTFERVDPAKIQATMTLEAFFDPPEVKLKDPAVVFETWQEFEATLLSRYLNQLAIPANEEPFIDKRFATLLAYRVRVELKDLEAANRAKAEVLRSRSGSGETPGQCGPAR